MNLFKANITEMYRMKPGSEETLGSEKLDQIHSGAKIQLYQRSNAKCNALTLCMLGNFSCTFVTSCADFFFQN